VQFEIVQQIRYAYSRPVFVEPHLFRLQPRVDGSQILESHRLVVTPQPAGLSTALDAEGNTTSIAWFSGLHSELTVTARSLVSTGRVNPFSFLLTPGRTTLPMSYPTDEEELLLATRRRVTPESGGDPVRHFAEEICMQADRQVLSFLWRLTERLQRHCEVIRRETGAPFSPAETLSRRSGACRDLAVLFVDVCRCMGLAARFVSGYQYSGEEQIAADLHAWAEVYLPGAGWRGYDPTLGLAVADRHIALAGAWRADRAAPISGTFRGTSATGAMTTSITIHAIEPAAAPQPVAPRL
jgi:transglutaminase-like putative cysteine protease